MILAFFYKVSSNLKKQDVIIPFAKKKPCCYSKWEEK
jgi:hypothetical protein